MNTRACMRIKCDDSRFYRYGNLRIGVDKTGEGERLA